MRFQIRIYWITEYPPITLYVYEDCDEKCFSLNVLVWVYIIKDLLSQVIIEEYCWAGFGIYLLASVGCLDFWKLYTIFLL